MNDELVSIVMDEVMKSINESESSKTSNSAVEKKMSKQLGDCSLTEYVGVASGHTIGMVIANIDPQMQEKLAIPKEYRAIGVVGSRTGAAPQIFAADEAVKASNSKIARIEITRDSEGGAGQGCMIVFGAEDVSDVRRAVEVCLEQVDIAFGEVYKNNAGHLEFQYTARASDALNKAYGAEIGKSFGLTIGSPAAIGVLMADKAVKAATLNIVKVVTPQSPKSSFANEVIFAFSGDSGAVKQAILSAREIGEELLSAMSPGEEIKSEKEPYIL